jgi:hypothetical protein
MRVQELFGWMQERHAIYQRRQQGSPKPWTHDPILQHYRFCNVYRELDKVTQWITDNWRQPHRDDPNVWFAMSVARLVNWPETLADVGYPVPWDAKHFRYTLDYRAQWKKKVFTGVYIIPVSAGYKSKSLYLAEKVLTPLWENRDHIRQSMTSLAAFHNRLMGFKGLGSFLAGQIVADTKYTALLENASDWWDWACSGPGSRRGLNRIFNHPVNRPWNEEAWFVAMCGLKAAIGPLVLDAGMPSLHMQDLQNCLCEFSKYEKARLGEGRLRNRYAGLPDPEPRKQ